MLIADLEQLQTVLGGRDISGKRGISTIDAYSTSSSIAISTAFASGVNASTSTNVQVSVFSRTVVEQVKNPFKDTPKVNWDFIKSEK